MMTSTPVRVVLDANVLFPFTLRDTLLRAAEKGLFQFFWSEQILDEVRRNLVTKLQIQESKAALLVAKMQQAFPEATGEGFEGLIPSMSNDEKDRHVAALAAWVGADAIVTDNLRDFSPLPNGIEALSSDEFLLRMLAREERTMLELIVAQAAALRRPPRTRDDVLCSLQRVVPGFVAGMRSAIRRAEGA